MLLLFGRDLCDAWGWRRFVGVYLGIGAAAGAPDLPRRPGLARAPVAELHGQLAVVDALVITWALLFPTRQIMFNLVIPVSGKALVWITVGFTVFFALLSGSTASCPTSRRWARLAYMRGAPLLRRRWLTLRLRGRAGSRPAAALRTCGPWTSPRKAALVLTERPSASPAEERRGAGSLRPPSPARCSEAARRLRVATFTIRTARRSGSAAAAGTSWCCPRRGSGLSEVGVRAPDVVSVQSSYQVGSWSLNRLNASAIRTTCWRSLILMA